MEKNPKILQQLIDQQGMSELIRLAGFQADTTQWYEAMDIYALSSLREGLPNVILEAMALGTPIVATKVAGVPRIIDQGHNGLVVPIGDENRLTDALRILLDDAELRNQLATAGRQVIETRYSFVARMKKITQVYDDLLGTDVSKH